MLYEMSDAERFVLTPAEMRTALSFNTLTPQQQAAFLAGRPGRLARAAAAAADLAEALPQGADAAIDAAWERGSRLARGEPVPPVLPAPRPAAVGKITLNPDDVWGAAIDAARDWKR